MMGFCDTLHITGFSLLVTQYEPSEIKVGGRIVYTGCSRRNVPDFGRVFLMLNYTDITQNTYIQS